MNKYDQRCDPENDALMVEGYREMASENLRLANEAFYAASEVMLRNKWEVTEVE